ncbi:MAG: CoA-binding protein [candidate division Zixibacteria bacterium]|nr:CoA-binding protein [candidate division Zixibacteria bacterium]
MKGDIGKSWENPTPDKIRRLLQTAHTIAVVGLSSNPAKASYGIARYLEEQGYRIIPVNPNEPEILGEKSYSDLLLVPESIDIVNVFRRADAALEITDKAISIGAKAIWFQESIISEESFRKGEKAGLMVVMDRCIYKEHSRLLG